MVLHWLSAGKATFAPDKSSFRGMAGSKSKPAPLIVSTASLARAANTSHPSPRTTPSTCLTRAFRLSRVMSPAGQNKEKEGHTCSPQELCRAQRQAALKAAAPRARASYAGNLLGAQPPKQRHARDFGDGTLPALVSKKKNESQMKSGAT